MLFRLLDCMSVVKIVCFYKSDHAFKTIWWRPCSFHLRKIKACFLKPDRPVFIIVINTSCSGVCYRIYARQKFFNNALAPALFGIFAGRISCNKRPHTQYLLLQLESRTQPCHVRIWFMIEFRSDTTPPRLERFPALTLSGENYTSYVHQICRISSLGGKLLWY